MTFTSDTQGKLDTVAGKIQKTNKSAAERLFRLSAAVGRAPDSMANAWAATDVHYMIDARVIAEQMRAQDIPGLWLRFLEWVRNVLIFLPLVVTWYGVSRAMGSYSVYVNAIVNDPRADKTPLTLPFLYLWEQGFGGHLPGWLVLSQLAFYDFVLLALLFLLTGFVNIRSHLRTSRKEQEAELVQEELTDALADAALCLTDRRGQQPMDAVDIAKQLLDELGKERQRLDALSSRREKELADLKGFTDALIPISRNMLEGAVHIKQSADNLTLAFQQSTNNLAQVFQNITPQIQQMATDQKQLLGTVGQLFQVQNGTYQEVKQLVEDQKNWGQALEDAVDEFTVSTRGINQFTGQINQWSNHLSGLVTQLTNEHQAQTTVSQMTADAARGLQEALKEIQQASNNLRSMAADFYSILNMQKAFPDVVKASLNDVIRDYNNAAANVAQGGSNLSYAAKILYDAAGRLNGGNGHGMGGPVGP